MPAFRVYFMDDKSIVGADWIEAETSNDAISRAKHSLSSNQKLGRLVPNGLVPVHSGFD